MSQDFGSIGASRLGAVSPLHNAGTREAGAIPGSLAAKIKQRQTAQKIYDARPRGSAAVAATSRTFIEAPRSYVLLNASPDAIIFDSQSYFILVPPRGEVIPYEQPPRFNSISLIDDATGDYVPGSVVINDLFIKGEFGEQVLIYDVVKAIKDCLGQDLVSGPLAKRGLSVMPLDASQELIDALGREGASRWEVHRIENAKAAVRAEQEKLDRFRKLGLPAPPPAPDVEEQALFLQEVAARQRARIADILNADTAPPASDATKVAGMRSGVLDLIAQPTLQTPTGGAASVRAALLDGLRNDPELRKFIVESATALENKSKAAQEVFEAAAEVAPVGETFSTAEELAPPIDVADPVATAAPAPVRVQGHPRATPHRK